MAKNKVKYCYLNGKITPINKAFIHVTDIGFLRGYGVTDFLRTYNGRSFLLREHYDRLKNSAKILDLKLSMSFKKFDEIISNLIKKNGFKESIIKIILTGGNSKDGMSFNSSTFCILVDELKIKPDSNHKKGGSIITLDYKRVYPEAKTTNYISAVKIYNSVLKKKNLSEILYIIDGNVLEGSRSNFFLFKKDKLVTAKDGILKGETRNTTLKLAKKMFIVEERVVTQKDLKEATEAFMTGTVKEILPIVKIDGKKIGDGKVGKNTKQLMQIFSDFVSSH